MNNQNYDILRQSNLENRNSGQMHDLETGYQNLINRKTQGINIINFWLEKSKDNEDYKFQFRKIVKTLNQIALDILNENDYDFCKYILDYCLKLFKFGMHSQLLYKSDQFIDLKVYILNNYAILYKKQEKYNQSLEQLNIAIKTLQENNIKEYLGLTYINMCSLFSKNNLHKKALEAANLSVYYCKQEFDQTLQKLKNSDKNNEQLKQSTKYYAISLYNRATEESYLKNIIQAEQSYEDAKVLVLNYLGQSHPLINQIQSAINNIKQKSNKSQFFMKQNFTRSYISQNKFSQSVHNIQDLKVNQNWQQKSTKPSQQIQPLTEIQKINDFVNLNESQNLIQFSQSRNNNELSLQSDSDQTQDKNFTQSNYKKWKNNDESENNNQQQLNYEKLKCEILDDIKENLKIDTIKNKVINASQKQSINSSIEQIYDSKKYDKEQIKAAIKIQNFIKYNKIPKFKYQKKIESNIIHILEKSIEINSQKFSRKVQIKGNILINYLRNEQIIQFIFNKKFIHQFLIKKLCMNGQEKIKQFGQTLLQEILKYISLVKNLRLEISDYIECKFLKFLEVNLNQNYQFVKLNYVQTEIKYQTENPKSQQIKKIKIKMLEEKVSELENKLQTQIENTQSIKQDDNEHIQTVFSQSKQMSFNNISQNEFKPIIKKDEIQNINYNQSDILKQINYLTNQFNNLNSKNRKAQNVSQDQSDFQDFFNKKKKNKRYDNSRNVSQSESFQKEELNSINFSPKAQTFSIKSQQFGMHNIQSYIDKALKQKFKSYIQQNQDKNLYDSKDSSQTNYNIFNQNRNKNHRKQKIKLNLNKTDLENNNIQVKKNQKTQIFQNKQNISYSELEDQTDQKSYQKYKDYDNEEQFLNRSHKNSKDINLIQVANDSFNNSFTKQKNTNVQNNLKNILRNSQQNQKNSQKNILRNSSKNIQKNPKQEQNDEFEEESIQLSNVQKKLQEKLKIQEMEMEIMKNDFLLKEKQQEQQQREIEYNYQIKLKEQEMQREFREKELALKIEEEKLAAIDRQTQLEIENQQKLQKLKEKQLFDEQQKQDELKKLQLQIQELEKQKEIEKFQQLELEKQKELERQKELEKQKEIEKLQQLELEKQIQKQKELEILQQIEIEKQQELEKQNELEKQEKEQQKIIEKRQQLEKLKEQSKQSIVLPNLSSLSKQNSIFSEDFKQNSQISQDKAIHLQKIESPDDHNNLIKVSEVNSPQDQPTDFVLNNEDQFKCNAFNSEISQKSIVINDNDIKNDEKINVTIDENKNNHIQNIKENTQNSNFFQFKVKANLKCKVQHNNPQDHNDEPQHHLKNQHKVCIQDDHKDDQQQNNQNQKKALMKQSTRKVQMAAQGVIQKKKKNNDLFMFAKRQMKAKIIQKFIRTLIFNLKKIQGFYTWKLEKNIFLKTQYYQMDIYQENKNQNNYWIKVKSIERNNSNIINKFYYQNQIPLGLYSSFVKNKFMRYKFDFKNQKFIAIQEQLLQQKLQRFAQIGQKIVIFRIQAEFEAKESIFNSLQAVSALNIERNLITSKTIQIQSLQKIGEYDITTIFNQDKKLLEFYSVPKLQIHPQTFKLKVKNPDQILKKIKQIQLRMFVQYQDDGKNTLAIYDEEFDLFCKKIQRLIVLKLYPVQKIVMQNKFLYKIWIHRSVKSLKFESKLKLKVKNLETNQQAMLVLKGKLLDFLKILYHKDIYQIPSFLVKFIDFEKLKFKDDVVQCQIHQRIVLDEHKTVFKSFYNNTELIFTRNQDEIMYKLELKNRNSRRIIQLAKFVLDKFKLFKINSNLFVYCQEQNQEYQLIHQKYYKFKGFTIQIYIISNYNQSFLTIETFQSKTVSKITTYGLDYENSHLIKDLNESHFHFNFIEQKVELTESILEYLKFDQKIHEKYNQQFIEDFEIHERINLKKENVMSALHIQQSIIQMNYDPRWRHFKIISDNIGTFNNQSKETEMSNSLENGSGEYRKSVLQTKENHISPKKQSIKNNQEQDS